MKCSNCGKNNANISYKQNINGEVTNLNLCESCAKKLGIFNSFDDIFTPMVLDWGYVLPEEIKCKNCGYTLSKYKSTGLFGCPSCYDTFKKEVDSILLKIQGKNRNIESKNDRAIVKNVKEKIKSKKKNELEELKDELQKLIKEEKFEDAAIVRDKIKAIESKGGEQ